MNKDQIRGRVKEADGKAEETLGTEIGDKKMMRRGKTKKNVGKIQAGYGDLKDDLKNGA